MAPIDPLESVRVSHLPSPIERHAIEDRDIAQERNYLRIRLRLKQFPDERWVERFHHEITENVTKDTPTGATVQINVIDFTVSEETVELALAEVDARIARTNTWYFDVLVPKLARQREAEASAAAAEADRANAVRSRLRGK